ncbi:uncharacterized protein P884DRAFT_330103 [Thermothelomyces heterothallicus CBS 202.75]|uniref:uncharacterized protein n=1 Tax=Thermothelomyces heterothallicus CBS 202.75 TaxID=1149848 RepID=UPI0037425822
MVALPAVAFCFHQDQTPGLPLNGSDYSSTGAAQQNQWTPRPKDQSQQPYVRVSQVDVDPDPDPGHERRDAQSSSDTEKDPQEESEPSQKSYVRVSQADVDSRSRVEPKDSQSHAGTGGDPREDTNLDSTKEIPVVLGNSARPWDLTVHALPLATTALLIAMNVQRWYWAREDADIARFYNRDTLLSVLQFVAKVYELLVISSLGALWLNVSHAKPSFGWYTSSPVQENITLLTTAALPYRNGTTVRMFTVPCTTIIAHWLPATLSVSPGESDFVRSNVSDIVDGGYVWSSLDRPGITPRPAINMTADWLSYLFPKVNVTMPDGTVKEESQMQGIFAPVVMELFDRLDKMVHIDLAASRYGYGSGKIGWPMKFALAVMYIFLIVVETYFLYITLWQRLRRKQPPYTIISWGDLVDLVVLPWNSKPSHNPRLNRSSITFRKRRPGPWKIEVGIMADSTGRAQMNLGNAGIIDIPYSAYKSV